MTHDPICESFCICGIIEDVRVDEQDRFKALLRFLSLRSDYINNLVSDWHRDVP